MSDRAAVPNASGTRVVFDTNVLISSLLFQRGQLSWLRTAWITGVIKPLVSQETSAEFLRVLGYTKFKLTAQNIEAAILCYLPYTEIVQTESKHRPHLSMSRDPKDDIFLQLAHDAKAEVLVSGDQDLLCLDDTLGKHTSFRIMTPQSLKIQLNIQ